MILPDISASQSIEALVDLYLEVDFLVMKVMITKNTLIGDTHTIAYSEVIETEVTEG